MILRATRDGLAALRRSVPLVITLWLVNLALAVAAGAPAFVALLAATSRLPEADALADGFRVGIAFDLARMRPGLLASLAGSALGAAFLGLLAGAAATGGAFEVLVSRDERPFAHRFGRGAGRFFFRFLRAGLVAGLAGALAAALLGGPILAVGARLWRASGSEALVYLVRLLGGAVAGTVFLLALLALDAARVRVVREDARRVLPMLGFGLGVVLRHPVAWLGTWGLNALLGLAAFGLYLAFRHAAPAGTVGLALVMFGAQQAFVLVRSGLRVCLLGSEVALVERLRPRPAVAPPPQPAAPPPAPALFF